MEPGLLRLCSTVVVGERVTLSLLLSVSNITMSFNVTDDALGTIDGQKTVRNLRFGKSLGSQVRNEMEGLCLVKRYKNRNGGKRHPSHLARLFPERD